MAINVGELFVTLDLRDKRFSLHLRRAMTSLRNSGDELGRHAARFTSSVASMVADAARLGIALTVTAAKWALLSSATAGVANGVVSLGASLAPLVGAVAALPGAVAIGAAALVALTVALYGVKDAFSAALGDDAAKFEEAVAKLAPAAQAVARELRSLKPLLDGIRVTVQEALFAPLVGQLSALAATLAIPLTSGLANVADALGMAGARAAEFARSSVAVSALNAVFDATRQIINDLSVAIEPLGAGLARLVEVGAGFSASLAPGIAQAAARFGEWLTAAADSGRALGWMQGAVDVLKQLGSVALDVWGVLSGVFAAMRRAGGDALGVLGSILDRLNAWVNSASGQQTLTAIFVAMGQAAGALGPVLVALAEGVGMLAPLLGLLAQQVGPILTAAIHALVPALASLRRGDRHVRVAAARRLVARPPGGGRVVPRGHRELLPRSPTGLGEAGPRDRQPEPDLHGDRSEHDDGYERRHARPVQAGADRRARHRPAVERSVRARTGRPFGLHGPGGDRGGPDGGAGEHHGHLDQPGRRTHERRRESRLGLRRDARRPLMRCQK
ncbi:hypothetical protein [Nonomuraea basaltis]|uniref:hypothetical protein n=1 Tax=Nonomuraea basaltis TaxID=2495887 RepID=UPI00110C5989|nr:hypothetical protein [Nonomuraea basaltis]TMR97529.1 hypothetical protein EJK15_17570 [Nonomuraea basaltis]